MAELFEILCSFGQNIFLAVLKKKGVCLQKILESKKYFSFAKIMQDCSTYVSFVIGTNLDYFLELHFFLGLFGKILANPPFFGRNF